jgi:HSP20 family molecular chaperone IbpA
MKCRFCRKELGKDWNFCAYCGKDLPKVFKFRLPNLGFGREEDTFESFHLPFGGGSIQISFGTPQRQKVFRPRIKSEPISVPRQTGTARTQQKVIEPKTTVRTAGAGIEIFTEMPGVSEENIKVNKVGESLEIRGYAEDKTYFKIVPINKNLIITSSSLENNVLRLSLARA